MSSRDKKIVNNAAVLNIAVSASVAQLDPRPTEGQEVAGSTPSEKLMD